MRDYAEQVKRLRNQAKLERYYNGSGEICDDAADAIEELLAAVSAQKETIGELRKRNDAQADVIDEEWTSVEERLPEDFQKVLVFWWEHSEPMVDTAFWQKDAKRFDGEHWVRMEDEVTHWMPLPEPPKGVE